MKYIILLFFPCLVNSNVSAQNKEGVTLSIIHYCDTIYNEPDDRVYVKLENNSKDTIRFKRFQRLHVRGHHINLKNKYFVDSEETLKKSTCIFGYVEPIPLAPGQSFEMNFPLIGWTYWKGTSKVQFFSGIEDIHTGKSYTIKSKWITVHMKYSHKELEEKWRNISLTSN